MSRHSFRSQPTLQRSGGGGPPAIVALGLLALVGVGGGVVLGKLVQGSAPALEVSYPAHPVDEPATSATSPPPTPQAQVRTGAPVMQPSPEPRVAPAVARIKANAPVSSLRKPKATRHADVAPPPEESWAQQQQDYERARAAYDANERTAGYRWAQQNNIRFERYCRIAAQRTSAFVEGCMSFLHPGPSGGDDKSGPSPGARLPEQG
jgi:hypothetical protein